MRLSRRISRGLGSGAAIIVDRVWGVHFARQGIGAVINGKLESANVDAPAALEALAELEEDRSTDSMFPILLSDTGAVVGAGDYLLEEDMAAAVAYAEALIHAGPASSEKKAQRLNALSAMQQGAGKLLAQIPPDLFFPVMRKTTTIKPLTLANGITGQFELTYVARCAPDLPWLEQVERHIVTRVAGTERRSSDIWSMAKA